MTPRRIRTLIVDDSALVRKIVCDSLSRFPDIQVVGTAVDPYAARDKILELEPDVITLDIEMPRMDGITFLKILMKHRPMPVVVMSSLTSDGSEKAFEALQAGAVDVIGKPNGSRSAFEDGERLAEKIRAAAQARVHPISEPRPVGFYPSSPAMPVTASRRQYSPRSMILMGASTGGTEALKAVLTELPGDLPGICVVQHIPAYFSKAFACRLNTLCRMEVREAQQGDKVAPGLVLIAPGGLHMILRWSGLHYTVELNEGPKIHHQRPSVDVLFDSAVKAGGGTHALAVLLTGMGADGAAGMLKLREAGAATVAQNEETCVVFGMPREAIRCGAVQRVLPLGQIAGEMDRFAAKTAMAGSASTI